MPVESWIVVLVSKAEPRTVVAYLVVDYNQETAEDLALMQNMHECSFEIFRFTLDHGLPEGIYPIPK